MFPVFISCPKTGGIYLGSAVDIYDRFYDHLNGHCSNLHLQNAINLYGHDTFIFRVVELCERNVLLAREQFYLDLLFTAVAPALIFNFARDALAPFTGRTHSKDTRAAPPRPYGGCSK